MIGDHVISPTSPLFGRVPRRSRSGLRRPGAAVRLRVIVLAALTACGGLVALAGNAYGGGTNSVEQIRVHTGDTLWSIAQRLYPEDDARERVADIAQINHLQGDVIVPGEVLTVPAP